MFIKTRRKKSISSRNYEYSKILLFSTKILWHCILLIIGKIISKYATECIVQDIHNENGNGLLKNECIK